MLLDEFPDVLSDKTGSTDLITHTIRLTDEIPCSRPAYRIPDSLKSQVEDEILKLLEEGHIQHSESDFCSPLVIVRKRDGKSIRITTDLTQVNAKTINDNYPMSLPSDILNKAATARFVSTIDLNRAYYQVKLSPESRKYCAFKTHIGLMEWVSMPMGCRTASRTYQRLLDRLLRGIHSFSAALQDDVTIYSMTWDSHLEHLREVLNRMRNAGLTVNTSKCQFALRRLQILGHILDVEKGQILPSDDKIRAIQDFKRPLNKSQLKAWLGLTGYYRHMIKGYAEIVWCLTELLRKNMPDKLKWSEVHEQAFLKLKDHMTSNPILVAPNPNKDYILQCDATQTTVAGILSQLDDQGQERVIAYASRKLLPRERKYPTIQRELLAICWCLEHWDQYVYGKHVDVFSDHRPLAWLQLLAQHSSRLARWIILLQKYDISTTFRRGIENQNADGLSRLETVVAPPSE